MPRRAALIIAVALAITPFLLAPFAGSAPDASPQEFSGKVVPLSEQLEKLGAKLDKDAAPYWLALVTEDGKTYLLIKDAGSRMFFKDKQMLNRPVQLTGRVVGDAKMLQVLSVRTVVNGKLHEPYYWCDICKIKRFEPCLCDCCNAPLEFREEPVAK
jgi:hypothetical protein